jgi:tetratricopeptide (TPR) repeat protein
MIISELLSKAIELEDAGDHQKAAKLYEEIISAGELDETTASAHINLGNILYNRKDYTGSVVQYRSALRINPKYALAYFDLANVLDEIGRHDEAVASYTAAIEICPTYADAHYNLALNHERSGHPLKALQHWQRYVKLDKSGAWHKHATNQIARIMATKRLICCEVVWSNPAPNRTPDRANLCIAGREL